MKLPIKWKDLEKQFKQLGMPEEMLEQKRKDYVAAALAWDATVIAMTQGLREAFTNVKSDGEKEMLEGMILTWLQEEYSARIGLAVTMEGKHWN